MSKLVILLVLTISSTFIDAYRILGVFPFHGKSHNIMFNALMTGLAERNHQVDVITHYPPQNPPPNYKVVVKLNRSENAINSFVLNSMRSTFYEVTSFLATIFGNNLCHLMNSEDMQKFIKNPPNDPPYDLVITEAFAANCYYGFGHLLQVPVVAVSTYAENPWINEYIGNNDNAAFAPNTYYYLRKDKFDKFSFWDRLFNTISYRYKVYRFNQLTAVQTDLMRKYLSPDMPDVRELERNLSLMLTNRHPAIHGPKPDVPAVVGISGLHINKNNSHLNSKLKKWLDKSKDGVVYFTLGSAVAFETLSTKIIDAFYKSFAKIAPMRVLMKVTNADKLPPGLPNNTLTLPWIPQQAVLNHTNVRVFITHGGLMGVQEALYFGVPMIGIPLFGDQAINVAKCEENNMAVRMSYDNITEASINEALSAILANPKYRENIKSYSKIFKDRPMEAMDTAAFWIEYVVRNGNKALRSPSLDLAWWQVALLDVYGFIFFCLILMIIPFYYSIKFFIKKCFSFSSKKLKYQ